MLCTDSALVPYTINEVIIDNYSLSIDKYLQYTDISSLTLLWGGTYFT